MEALAAYLPNDLIEIAVTALCFIEGGKRIAAWTKNKRDDAIFDALHRFAMLFAGKSRVERP